MEDISTACIIGMNQLKMFRLGMNRCQSLNHGPLNLDRLIKSAMLLPNHTIKVNIRQ